MILGFNMLDFYSLPLHTAFIITFAAVLILGAVISLIGQKSRKAAAIISAPVLLAYGRFVLRLTVLSRTVRTERSIDLTPFSMLVNAGENPENYRSILMNIYLFMPFGAAVALCLINMGKNGLPPGKGNKTLRAIIAVFLIGAVFSSAIEVCQYIFMRGFCQTDDIICNVLGAIFGCTALIPGAVIAKIRNKKHRKHRLK